MPLARRFRSLDALEPLPIPGSEGGYGPCFSPDGQSVAFFSIFGGARQTGLVRTRIAGGTPTLVVELPSSAVAGFDHAMAFTKSTGFAEIVPLDPGQAFPAG